MSDSNNWLEECYQSYRKFCIDNEVFRKAAWTKADGDHTHCLFDAQKISNYDIDDNDKQGYCGDKGTWFCASCFEELIKRHNVRVEKNTILSIENALRRFSNVIISLNNEQYFLKNKDEKITVEHLLRHQGGYSIRSGDPLFCSVSVAKQLGIAPPVGFDDMVRYAAETRLRYEPGSSNLYSSATWY